MSAPAPALPELAGNLWRLAEATAGGRGFRFSSESALEMQKFIRVGVDKLTNDGAQEDSQKIGAAKDAVVRLVDKMIEQTIEKQRSQKIKGYEATTANVLHDYRFFSARSWFCPCYPFCCVSQWMTEKRKHSISQPTSPSS
jgi:hypothetical protein